MKSNEDFIKSLGSAANNVNDIKGMADVIGMPDEQDKLYIQRLILKYDKKYPGRILHTVQEARKDLENVTVPGKARDLGIVDKGSNRRYVMELPEELGHWIEQAYPTMFREKKHLHWLLKNFPELRIPYKA